VLLAAAAVLVGAATQSATGFGFALVAGPALFAVLDPAEAVAALAVLGVVLSLLVLADGGPDLVRWRALLPLLLAAVPGLALGVLVLDLLSKAALQLGVGVAVVAAALLQASTRTAGEARLHGSAPAGGVVGLVSGTLTTSIGVNGPPVVLWLEARGAPPGEFRATLAATFLVLNVGGVVALVAAQGAGEVIDAGRLLPLVGLVLAGHVGGALAFRRLDAGSFRRAVLVLVIAAGIASAVAGFVGLGSG
jgi:uncharacterized membrane protein YfcA